MLISSTSGQFPWQLKEGIIPFLEEHGELVERLGEIAQDYRETYPEMFYVLARRVEFIHYLSAKVTALTNLYTENLIPFLLLKPPLENSAITILLGFFLSLLAPLYILAILSTTIYLLFISGSLRGRAKAKETFIKLILGLGIIMLTLPIMQLLSEISHTFSFLILSWFNPNPEIFKLPISFLMTYFTFTTFFKPIFGSFFLLLSILLPIMVLVVLSFRYLLVILFTLFFPFTILFYSFSPTKRLGKAILFQTFLWSFLPLLGALIIGATSIATLTFPVPELKIFVSCAGYLLLIFSPLLVIGILNFILGLGIISSVQKKVNQKVSELVG